jgi:hypothetical protein
MKLYAKGYDPKKGLTHKDNDEHYVVVDPGSAAEASYLGQGFAPNAEYDAATEAPAAEAPVTGAAAEAPAAEAPVAGAAAEAPAKPPKK